MVRREGTENTSVVTPLVDDNAGVRIVGRGTLSGSGLPFVLVSSSSEPGRVHCVAYAYEGAYVGARIHCDCVAASYDRSCNHVRLVLAWLTELMERAPLRAADPRAADPRAATTGAKKRASAPTPPDVAGETMVNRTRPFSLMKT